VGDLGGAAGRTLLYVHGRDFKPAADDFMDITVSAMLAGIERDYPDFVDEFCSLDKRLAYYGDLTDSLLSSKGYRYDEALDVADRRNALTTLRSFDRKKHFGVTKYDRLPGKTALAEFAADVFAPLLGRLGLSNKLIAKVGVDLAEYWNSDGDFADTIRERVRTAICQALDNDNQVMLVSHGTGCIVAYDVLWQLSNDPQYEDTYRSKKIDLWLTIGAPLGDSMVARRLLGSDCKGFERYPSNVVSWHNMSAEDDFVSHDNTLADDFRPMLKQKQVSCIRDYRIYNLAVRYGKSNPHSSLGYLVHPRMAQIIVEWIQQSPIGQVPKSIL
jgi:hypothetical protein